MPESSCNLPLDCIGSNRRCGCSGLSDMSEDENLNLRSDGELLQAATEGDEQAFWEFCVRSLPTLLRVVHARSKLRGFPTDLVSDAVHEAMIRAIAWQRTHQGTRLSLNWLIRTAMNVLIDWLRQRRHKVSLSDEMLEERQGMITPSEEVDEVLAGLERLPTTDREILELVLIKGISFPEIGDRLRISTWGAYKRYERALSRLRNLLRQV